MGLLDSIVGGLGGQSGNSGLMQIVSGLINNQSGGLAGLLQQFNANGLGHLADSWVGTGQNLPISADQLQGVLGSNQLHQMASKLGLTPDALSGQLAQLLPQVIDKLTPHGSVPDQGSVQQGLGGLLKGLLG
jgi:uncharacterized protein YidB (DUF937 family)